MSFSSDARRIRSGGGPTRAEERAQHSLYLSEPSKLSLDTLMQRRRHVDPDTSVLELDRSRSATAVWREGSEGGWSAKGVQAKAPELDGHPASSDDAEEGKNGHRHC